ncbi:hypothetical protein HMPREF9429_01768, partial [Megasphaera micronuciformis F0359]
SPYGVTVIKSIERCSNSRELGMFPSPYGVTVIKSQAMAVSWLVN